MLRQKRVLLSDLLTFYPFIKYFHFLALYKCVLLTYSTLSTYSCLFRAAMESSSVYMCFPCYREFPTLEEVLAHQMTCTAETPQLLPNETPIEAAAAAAGLSQVYTHFTPKLIQSFIFLIKLVSPHEVILTWIDLSNSFSLNNIFFFVMLLSVIS